MTTNGAAQRLPNSEGERLLRRRMQEWEFGQQWLDALDEALAAERRATVERIVDAIPTLEWIVLPDSIIDPFRAEGWPFDEEAAR